MATYESWFLSSDGVMRRRKRNQFNQDSGDNNTEILRNDMSGINESRYKEKNYNNGQSKDDVEIHKFPRSDYSFVNGIRDDKEYLIIAKKGVLDEMAEDATQNPESAKRVDSNQGLGYWKDSHGNLRFPGDGLGDGLGDDARQEYINSWKR